MDTDEASRFTAVQPPVFSDSFAAGAGSIDSAYGVAELAAGDVALALEVANSDLDVENNTRTSVQVNSSHGKPADTLLVTDTALTLGSITDSTPHAISGADVHSIQLQPLLLHPQPTFWDTNQVTPQATSGDYQPSAGPDSAQVKMEEGETAVVAVLHEPLPDVMHIKEEPPTSASVGLRMSQLPTSSDRVPQGEGTEPSATHIAPVALDGAPDSDQQATSAPVEVVPVKEEPAVCTDASLGNANGGPPADNREEALQVQHTPEPAGPEGTDTHKAGALDEVHGPAAASAADTATMSTDEKPTIADQVGLSSEPLILAPSAVVHTASTELVADDPATSPGQQVPDTGQERMPEFATDSAAEPAAEQTTPAVEQTTLGQAAASAALTAASPGAVADTVALATEQALGGEVKASADAGEPTDDKSAAKQPATNNKKRSASNDETTTSNKKPAAGKQTQQSSKKTQDSQAHGNRTAENTTADKTTATTANTKTADTKPANSKPAPSKAAVKSSSDKRRSDANGTSSKPDNKTPDNKGDVRPAHSTGKSRTPTDSAQKPLDSRGRGRAADRGREGPRPGPRPMEGRRMPRGGLRPEPPPPRRHEPLGATRGRRQGPPPGRLHMSPPRGGPGRFEPPPIPMRRLSPPRGPPFGRPPSPGPRRPGAGPPPYHPMPYSPPREPPLRGPPMRPADALAPPPRFDDLRGPPRRFEEPPLRMPLGPGPRPHSPPGRVILGPPHMYDMHRGPSPPRGLLPDPYARMPDRRSPPRHRDPSPPAKRPALDHRFHYPRAPSPRGMRPGPAEPLGPRGGPGPHSAERDWHGRPGASRFAEPASSHRDMRYSRDAGPPMPAPAMHRGPPSLQPPPASRLSPPRDAMLVPPRPEYRDMQQSALDARAGRPGAGFAAPTRQGYADEPSFGRPGSRPVSDYRHPDYRPPASDYRPQAPTREHTAARNNQPGSTAYSRTGAAQPADTHAGSWSAMPAGRPDVRSQHPHDMLASRSAVMQHEGPMTSNRFPQAPAPVAAAPPSLAGMVGSTGVQDKVWYYLDPKGVQQGRHSIQQFAEWLMSMSRPDMQDARNEFMRVVVWRDDYPASVALVELVKYFGFRL